MRAAILALFLALFALPARAGDTAFVEILGFSPDGRVFAFEEYGVQDGSGFPYSHRFYIDTSNDKFLANTPIRVTLEDEAATIEDARKRARIRGEKIVADALLARNRGFTAGFNAVTELSADPFRIAVNPRPVHPPVDDPVEFRLEEIPMGPIERCEGLGEIVGIRLVRVATEPGVETRLRHEDQKIPLSRGCPVGYRIGGLQTFFPDNGRPVYALLIAIRRFGFEGPDYRWIAATGRL
jgi:predicted secreted protein